jgi:hypothetical protein
VFLSPATCFDSKDSSDLRTVKPLGLEAFSSRKTLSCPVGRWHIAAAVFIFAVEKYLRQERRRRTPLDRMMITLLPIYRCTPAVSITPALDGCDEMTSFRGRESLRTPAHKTQWRLKGRSCYSSWATPHSGAQPSAR